jgi:hypothetical protein
MRRRVAVVVVDFGIEVIDTLLLAQVVLLALLRPPSLLLSVAVF